MNSLLPRLRTFWWRVTSCLTLRNVRFLYMLPGFTRRASRCPVCGAKPDKVEFVARFTPLDHCGQCGHVYSRKTPKKRILNLMYGDFAYWGHDKEHQGITKVECGPHWQGFVDARVGIAERAGILNGSPKRVFEIGCSEGIVLRALADRGHEALGCEMNKAIAEAGMKALGVTIKTALFEELELPRAYYDAVISFHTVEHLPELEGIFTKVARILKPDGTLLIEVPTGPEEYTNTDHLQFFSDASLKRLLEAFFDEAEIIPNHYTNPQGVLVGSLYGVGRRPALAGRGWGPQHGKA